MYGLLEALRDGAYIHMRNANEARETFRYLRRVMPVPQWVHDYINKQAQGVFSVRYRPYIYLHENRILKAVERRPEWIPYMTIDRLYTYDNKIDAQNIDVFFA